jgi:hypothetical protein
MPRDGEHGVDGLSRRQILKRVGAAGSVAALAGCSGDGGDGTETSKPDTDIEVVTATDTATSAGGTESPDETPTPTEEPTPVPKVDTTFRYSWARSTSLPEANINMLGANSSGELGWPVYARFGKPMVAADEWVHCDIEGWEFDLDNNELRITIKDGVKWHQGGEVIDDVTGEDFAMQNHFGRLMTEANPDGSTEENPTITGFDHDGKTYIAHLNPDGVNQQIVESGFPRTRIWMYRDYWRDEYEALKSASTQEEMNSIRQDVIEKTITLADDPPLSGPGMLQEVTTQGATFKRFEEHWAYDGLNWEEYEFVKLSGSSGSKYQAGVSDQIDYNLLIPDTVDSPPEHISHLYTKAGAGFGEALLINYGGNVDSWFGFEGSEPPEDSTAGKQQARARQAIAWALNGQQITQNRHGKYAGQFTSANPKPVCGSMNSIQKNFPDVWNGVPPMLKEQNVEKAKQALRKSGLTERNGSWYKPNDEELTIEIESFPWSRDLVETAVTNLKTANINAEHIVQEQSVLFGNLNSGGFGFAQSWHGMSGPLSASTPGWLTRNGSWETRYTPAEFKVPPIGEWDAEPSQTINAMDLSSVLSKTSLEDHKEELRKLVWAWMYHLPGIPIAPNPASSGWNDKHFELPEHPPRSSGTNGRFAVPGDGSVGAPVWGVGEHFRMVRRGLPQPNGPMARTE